MTMTTSSQWQKHIDRIWSEGFCNMMISDYDAVYILRDMAKTLELERPKVEALIQACRNMKAAANTRPMFTVQVQQKCWTEMTKALAAFDGE